MDTCKLKRILFTRKLSEKQFEFADNLGLFVDSKPFIEIDVYQLKECTLLQIKEDKNAAWIFTSQNSVDCLQQSFRDLSMLNDRIVYTIGPKTASILKKLGFQIKMPVHHNAESLVDLIRKETNESYLYFSGNLRRNVISQYLEEEQIAFQEIECYQTNLVQPNVDVGLYDAICFGSPSAAKSFFSKYRITEQVPCIAIGNTTAVTLLDFTGHVVMAEQTSVYSMLEICHEYLNS